jgi:hypothetical protein
VTTWQKTLFVGVFLLLVYGLIHDRIASFFGPHAGDPCDGSGHHYAPIVIGDASYLSCQAQNTLDRSRLPIQEALAGHWYREKSDKNVYYEVISHDASLGETKKIYGPVMQTWDCCGGGEASKGVIVNSFQTVDERQNMLVLTFKSANGVFIYRDRYTFSADRNTVAIQNLATRRGKLRDPPDILTYVDSQIRSQYVK